MRHKDGVLKTRYFFCAMRRTGMATITTRAMIIKSCTKKSSISLAMWDDRNFSVKCMTGTTEIPEKKAGIHEFFRPSLFPSLTFFRLMSW